ncbi:unnamed protein product [Pleuronectes platessa]|uniref:Uncharacterized protein n=1 Tax=Pleuronectes platessa TaxID=8262 RepID=A0A9N7UDT9_PLEPL|nr:unnamed protein product [Pleuronectes platessa]
MPELGLQWRHDSVSLRAVGTSVPEEKRCDHDTGSELTFDPEQSAVVVTVTVQPQTPSGTASQHGRLINSVLGARQHNTTQSDVVSTLWDERTGWEGKERREEEEMVYDSLCSSILHL